MAPLAPSLPLLLLLLLLFAPSAPQEIQVRGQGEASDPRPDSIKVVMSEGCASRGASWDGVAGGKEVDLVPGSPLVLTHTIKLVPSASGSCGCRAELAALQERLERLEREASDLRETCAGAKESKGAGCSIKQSDQCPNDCADQGRCLDGKCVCFPGFRGPDCSEAECPGNCSNRGRCVDGQCLCDPGFAGPDCSGSSCPDNCGGRGRCVDGKCVCQSGFAGADCSAASCPANCSSRGRCVAGRCVCADGFTGADCANQSCPGDCGGRGRCVDGVCACHPGFAGPDCSAKGCPGNCNSRGRCVARRCTCRRGFAGQDCSQCADGMTGPKCDRVMSGVSELGARDVTESSATLLWTPPPVEYDSYRITFTNQKDGEQQIQAQVDGGLSRFTQTGLAAGQLYSASVSGELDGRRGASSSTHFTTLISGPTNLRVLKTTTTSAVVQWEKSEGAIDRYRLTVTPSDGRGRGQEMTVAADQDSAKVEQLEAGRLYDVAVESEKGTGRSQPATTQVVPGRTFPKVTAAALTSEVTTAPGQGVNKEDNTLNQSAQDQIPEPQGTRKAEFGNVGGIDGRHEASSGAARHKPAVRRIVGSHGTGAKLTERLTLYRNPKGSRPLRSNTTRVVGTKVGIGPLKMPQMGQRKKTNVVPKIPEPVAPIKESRATEESGKGSDRRGQNNPAPVSGTDLETTRQGISEEPTKEPGQEEDTSPVTSKPIGTGPIEEKKCLNKVRVTHFRLPHKDQGSGCRGGATAETTLSPDPLSRETEGMPPFDLKLLSEVTDLDYPADPLHKLLTDTFGSLNISTFSLRLFKPTEPKPPSSFSTSSDSQSLFSPKSSPPSQITSSSTTSSHLISSTSSALTTSSPPPPPPSSSSPSLDDTDSYRSIPRDANDGRNNTDIASHDAQPSGNGGVPKLRTPPKPGFRRRVHPNLGSFQNRTHLNFGGPQRSRPNLQISPTTKPETTPTTTKESGGSSSFKVDTSVRDGPTDNDGAATAASTGLQTNQTEKRPIVFRRPPGGYVRRPIPNRGSLPNRTNPISRLLTRPTRPEPQTHKDQRSPAELLAATSIPVIRDSPLAKGIETVEERSEDKAGLRIATTSQSVELNQTVKDSKDPLYLGPITTARHLQHRHIHGGPLQNNTRLNRRPPQYPQGSLIRRPLPLRKVDGGSRANAGNEPRLPEEENPSKDANSQSGGQDVPRHRQGVQIGHTGAQGTAALNPGPEMEDLEMTHKPPITNVEKDEGALIPNSEPEETETSFPVANTDSAIHTQTANAGVNTYPKVQGLPPIRKTPSRPTRPVKPPKRPSPTRNKTGQLRTQTRHPISGRQKEGDPKPTRAVKRVFEGQSGPIGSTSPKPSTDSAAPEGMREDLNSVGVANRTSDGFTLVWDSPEGKYKNFVVSIKEVGKSGRPTENGKDLSNRQRGISEKQDGHEEDQATNQLESENGIHESIPTHVPNRQTSTTLKPATQNDKTIKEVLPGSVRSLHFGDLPPQTDYTVTLLGKGPGLLSRLHKLVISTGPEPPRDIIFSEVTDNSLTVSWTKPKSPVSGFKVTYTHTDEGEPVSVSLDSKDTSLNLSRLSPGSTYEVHVLSVLGLDESDPANDVVVTLPDPPTNLRAVNVTDTKALLLWRPALAAIDKYAIVYGSGSGSEMRITVSGNAAEHQLSDLEGSTTYTVTITSQLGSVESPEASTSFTTGSGKGGDGDRPQDLQAKKVTPRTALLSWKPPLDPTGGYRLTYHTEGHEMREMMVSSSATEYNLTRLYPGSKYTVQLQAESGGRYTTAISTDFTTGSLRFPFPTDCSQELLNGIVTSGQVEIFPQGIPTMVYCDMETEGGGWTVFQRRKDGSVDFFRGWKDYTKGFGDLSGEFWLGLNHLHNLTTMTKMTLRVDLRDGAESTFAKYSTFEVARRNFRLSVGGYSGSAGDSLSYHDNCVFSTKDRDPSPSITRCAVSYRGGWWYKNCHQANLNGLYGMDVKHQGVTWMAWKGKHFSIQFTEMKIRPASFVPPARG